MMTLTHQTKIAFQVIVDDDTGTVVNFLTALTVFIEMFISFIQGVSSVVLLVSDIIEAVSFTFTMWGIGLRSLAYGVGVKL